MTGAALTLALAYAAVAALLLSLNLATRYGTLVKASAIVAVTGLYFAAYEGHLAMLGWASPESLPEAFRLHWITIDEPDKVTHAPGAIYFWVRHLDAAGITVGEPRAYRLDWDSQSAREARAALERLENGEPLEGRISRAALSDEEPAVREGEDYEAGMAPSGSESTPPRFEFSRVLPPPLPPKAAPRTN